MPTRPILRLLAALGALGLAGCDDSRLAPLATVDHVDLPRFMGTWYVIANIPTALERGAYAARETYRLADDGTIETTFSFRAGSPGGELRRYTPRGFVLDTRTNAVWGMRFVWPVKSDYRIAYLADDYSTTIIARRKRDYVWIMARTPRINRATYERLVDVATSLGYERQRIQQVPQP